MTEISRAQRRHTGSLLVCGALLGLAILVLTLQLAPDAEPGPTRLAARYTARASGVWFLLAFSAGPLARLWRSALSAALLRERRGLGLAFCASHLVHLVAIGLLVAVSDASFGASDAGGALAYAFVVAMGLTSNDAAVRRLGARRWKILHTAGIWYLWFVFASGYIGALFAPDTRGWDYVMAPLLAAAMLARVVVMLEGWRQRRRAAIQDEEGGCSTHS